MMINTPGIISGAVNSVGDLAGWIGGKVNGAMAAVGGFVDNFKATAKTVYNRTVQTALDRFNSERAEYQKKGLVKYLGQKAQQFKTYAKEKFYQVKNAYDTHVKPLAQKYVAPAAHKILDPIVQSKTYTTILFPQIQLFYIHFKS